MPTALRVFLPALTGYGPAMTGPAHATTVGVVAPGCAVLPVTIAMAKAAPVASDMQDPGAGPGPAGHHSRQQ